MNTPVVTGVDGTGRSLRALLWAAHEASLRTRPLRVVHTLPRYEMDFPLFPPGRFEEAESHGKSVVEEAVALVRRAYPDVKVDTDMPMSSPAAAMMAESENAQAIVLGGKGDTVGNLLLGSTVLQVVGHARCPVIVVGHVSAGHDRIAVGTDGSAASDAALDYAFEEAQLRRADLLVLGSRGRGGFHGADGERTQRMKSLPATTAPPFLTSDRPDRDGCWKASALDHGAAENQLGHTSKTVTERHHFNRRLVVPADRAATFRDHDWPRNGSPTDALRARLPAILRALTPRCA